MNQDTTTGSVNVDLPTSQGVKHLPRLRISDVIRLKNRIAAERRAKILQNADDTIGRKSPEVITQLHEHDSRPVDRGAVVAWAMDPDGMLPVLAMAQLRTMTPPPQNEDEYLSMLKRAEAEVDSWSAEWNDLVTAAAGVLNIKIELKDKAPANPLASGEDAGKPNSPTSTTGAKQSA